MRSWIGRGELVGVRLARFDRRLSDERHAVLVVRQLDAVEVHSCRFAEFVLDVNSNAIAFADADLWTGHLLVVSPCFDKLARRSLPPNLLRSDVEDFYAFFDARLEKLIALAGSLSRECLDASFVHLIHRLGGGSRRKWCRIGRHRTPAVISVVHACLLGARFIYLASCSSTAD